MLNHANNHEEDQLLHGVAMTTSVSCHTHNESDHDNLSPSSNPYLPFLADHIQLQDYHQNHDFTYFIHGHDMKETKKARTKPLCQGDKTSIRLKSCSNNAWQSVLQLDNKLFWTHQTNILGKAQPLLTKISQAILTEQYCKLKAYQKQFLQIIKQIEFSLTECERQKKCLVNHIYLLKADNDSLYRTMLELYAEVQQLQNQCRQYFDNSLKQYIYSNSNQKSTKEGHCMSVGTVPFARTFSHNMEEINLIKIIEEEEKSVLSVPISLFAQFVLDLKKSTNDISTNGSKNYSFSPKISSQFGSQSVIRQWIKEIGQNLINLEQSKQILHQHSQKQISFFQEEFKPKVIEEFIETLSKSRPYILKKLTQHPQRELYFLHVVHSSVITFLGILAKETKQCYLQLSFGDNTRNWMNNLISQLHNIKQQFKLSLNVQLEEYMNNLQTFIGQINDLAVFRMQRLYNQ